MSSWPHNRQKPPRQDVAGQPIPVFFSTLLAVISHVPGTPTSIPVRVILGVTRSLGRPASMKKRN